MRTPGKPNAVDPDPTGKPQDAAGSRAQPASETEARGPIVGGDPDSWRRRKRETRIAYLAAEIYFRLGAERTLAQVAVLDERNLAQIKAWSAQNDWEVRAQAFDRHEAQVAQARLQASEVGPAEAGERNESATAQQETGSQVDPWEERRARVREREWEAAELMQTLAMDILKRNTKELIAKSTTAFDVIALCRKASELGRQAAEMPAKAGASKVPPETSPPDTSEPARGGGRA